MEIGEGESMHTLLLRCTHMLSNVKANVQELELSLSHLALSLSVEEGGGEREKKRDISPSPALGHSPSPSPSPSSHTQISPNISSPAHSNVSDRMRGYSVLQTDAVTQAALELQFTPKTRKEEKRGEGEREKRDSGGEEGKEGEGVEGIEKEGKKERGGGAKGKEGEGETDQVRGREEEEKEGEKKTEGEKEIEGASKRTNTNLNRPRFRTRQTDIPTSSAPISAASKRLQFQKVIERERERKRRERELEKEWGKGKSTKAIEEADKEKEANKEKEHKEKEKEKTKEKEEENNSGKSLENGAEEAKQTSPQTLPPDPSKAPVRLSSFLSNPNTPRLSQLMDKVKEDAEKEKEMERERERRETAEMEKELQSIANWEKTKQAVFYWFHNLVILVSLFNYFIIPFRFAFLHHEQRDDVRDAFENECGESHGNSSFDCSSFELNWSHVDSSFLSVTEFFFLFDCVTYLLNLGHLFAIRQQVLDDTHEKLCMKLGNSYIKDQMRKLSEKSDGRITVDSLATLLMTFPETDNTTNADLLQFVKDKMDINGDGTIDWQEVKLFLRRSEAARIARDNDEANLDTSTAGVINTPLENLIVTVPLGIVFSNWLLFLQFFRMHVVYREVIEKRPKSWRPNLFRLATLGVLTFFISHWVGCIWFIVGSLEGYGVNDWVPSHDLMDLPLFSKYLMSFYWGFINGMAIDHDSPQTNLEVVIVLSLLLVGLSMFATVIGNISSLLTEFDTDWLELQNKMDDLNEYMEEKSLPKDLQTRILNHFRYKWRKSRRADDETIESELPLSLRTDICMFLHREALEKIPLFRNTSSAFVSVLVRMMKPSVCAPGEYIVKFGDIGREMYFLHRGVCTVMNSAEDVIYAVFTSGSFFGEFALLFSQRRTATIKANTYCDLFTLSQEDLNSVLSDFPEFEVLIKKEGLRSVVTKFKAYPYLLGKDITEVTQGGGVITAVPSDNNTPMLDLVVSKLRPRMVTSGNAIFRSGVTTGEDGALFFVSKGTIILEDEVGSEEIFTIVEGQHFGHYSAQRHERRSLTARAKTECQLFYLTKSDFDSVVSQFPEFLDILNLESPSGEMEYFD